MNYSQDNTESPESTIYPESKQEWSHEDSFLLSHNTYEVNKGWGNDLNKKQAGNLRIYFQNINGITTNHSWDKWHQCVQEMEQNKVDIS